MGNKPRSKRRKSSEFNNFIIETRTRLAESKLRDTTNKINMSKEKANTDNLLNVIAPFDGKKECNIHYFIQEFDRAAVETNFSNEVKLIILRSKFVGTARERLQTDVELNSETDYVKFKEKVLQTFDAKKTFAESHNDFSKIQQKPGESMSDYIVRFNLVAAKFFDISGLSNKADARKLFDLMKLHRFLESIKPDIALEIRKRAIDKYKEATEIALTVEEAFASVKFEELNAISTNTTEFCESLLRQNEKQEKELRQLRAELEKLKNKPAEKWQTNSRNTKYCSICNLRNHETEECRYNVNNKRQFRNNDYQSNFPTHAQNMQGFTSPNNESVNFQGYGSVGNWNFPPPPFPPPLPMGQNYQYNYVPHGQPSGYGNYSGGNMQSNYNYGRNYSNGQEFHPQNQGQLNSQGNYRNMNNANRDNNTSNKTEGRKITGSKQRSGNI